jgi:hypothetical protein
MAAGANYEEGIERGLTGKKKKGQPTLGADKSSEFIGTNSFKNKNHSLGNLMMDRSGVASATRVF